MRKGETLEEEKARKDAEVFSKMLAERFDVFKLKLAKIRLVLSRIEFDSKESQIYRLAPCKCGRQWSRFDECAICLAERIEAEPELLEKLKSVPDSPK